MWKRYVTICSTNDKSISGKVLVSHKITIKRVWYSKSVINSDAIYSIMSKVLPYCPSRRGIICIPRVPECMFLRPNWLPLPPLPQACVCFSLNRSNGASKILLFVLISKMYIWPYKKVHPTNFFAKKLFYQLKIVFGAKLFLSAIFGTRLVI